jgi:hypothetical protein
MKLSVQLTIAAILLVISSNGFAWTTPTPQVGPPTSFRKKPTIRPGQTRSPDTRLALGGVGEAWDAYNAALEANPLIVKSVTAGIILGAADFAGQAIENVQKGGKAESDEGIDFARAARFAIFGLVLQAPWNHFYYQFLDGQIPPTEEPFSSTNLVKVFIDQFIQAPVFTVLIFVFLGLLEGKAFDSIKKQLDEDYKETILANWKLWVPATIINIGFVPPILRVLYLNCVFFFWSIYLSLVINKSEET